MYPRIYYQHLINILSKQEEMLFLMGARQVGKTTLAKTIAKNYQKSLYLNWDIDEHKELILSGQKFIEKYFPSEVIGPKPLIIFDELHKYKHWKNFIKGFYDLYQDQFHIIVTGSAHLNIYQKGGDSLMGRYLPYTIQPFTIGELNPTELNANLYRKAQATHEEDYNALYNFGGFPKPFALRDVNSYNQWKRTRKSQLFREDILDLTNIHEISQLELCGQLLSHQSGSLLNRSTVAKKLQISIQTVNRWIEVLKQFFYVFTIQPWTANIPHALIKEPKLYLYDWSLVTDQGARFETFVALHLKKAIDFWNESGQGEFELYFLRDKKQREVDFLITQSNVPWCLIEAKTSEQPITKALRYYQNLLQTPYTFQVTKEMEFVDYDCFSKKGIFIVPAKTLLSQLI